MKGNEQHGCILRAIRDLGHCLPAFLGPSPVACRKEDVTGDVASRSHEVRAHPITRELNYFLSQLHPFLERIYPVQEKNQQPRRGLE